MDNLAPPVVVAGRTIRNRNQDVLREQDRGRDIERSSEGRHVGSSRLKPAFEFRELLLTKARALSERPLTERPILTKPPQIRREMKWRLHIAIVL